jgi:8-oxo-dGTP pyrophosphatase MutT (NUDIX family)
MEVKLSQHRFPKLAPQIQTLLSYQVTNPRDGVERSKVVTYWLGKIRDPEKTSVSLSDEHDDYKWLKLEDACELAGFEDMKKAFRQCQEHIDKEGNK